MDLTANNLTAVTNMAPLHE